MNTPDNWRRVWSNRQVTTHGDDLLAALIAADGYDDLGAVAAKAWRDYVRHVADRLGIRPGDSVFEVGCGAGAFLYPLHQAGCRVAGIDYSATLVEAARRAMPGSTIGETEAGNLPTQPGYDFAISNGVFLYFPDLEYAASVLSRMTRLATRGLAVLDVPDVETRAESLAARKNFIGELEYARRYAGLSHLYFAREWFLRILADAGFTVQIERQCIAQYRHAPFRFNVYASRSH